MALSGPGRDVVGLADLTSLSLAAQQPRVIGISTGFGLTAYLPNSILAMALRWTSSGPSAKRSVRALT